MKMTSPSRKEKINYCMTNLEYLTQYDKEHILYRVYNKHTSNAKDNILDGSSKKHNTFRENERGTLVDLDSPNLTDQELEMLYDFIKNILK